VRPPSGAPFPGQASIDAQGPTLAQSDPMRAPSGPHLALVRPPSTPGIAWGSAVLVNRDGSDGQRFPLISEDTVIGRAGADIAFDDDRFLARQHARITRAPDGNVAVRALDIVNGVFMRCDAPVELFDGAVILLGREVLRFERLPVDERTAPALVRHGVAVFGSPPRDPWGRVVQLVPSGGARDVRHLASEEIVLGREEGDVVFRDDAFMSRRHAAIRWEGSRATLTDLGSSNGTFLRIAGVVPVKHGDHLRVGDQLLRIER
jgi:pSer/pThr/pTyr-binding forkhead associated (FHA) protein